MIDWLKGWFNRIFFPAHMYLYVQMSRLPSLHDARAKKAMVVEERVFERWAGVASVAFSTIQGLDYPFIIFSSREIDCVVAKEVCKDLALAAVSGARLKRRERIRQQVPPTRRTPAILT